MVEDKKVITPVVAAPPEPVKVKSEVELMTELEVALKSKDFKAVAKVSAEIDKLQKGKEKAELAEKQKVLEAKTDGVKVILTSVVAMMISGHKAGKAELDHLVGLLGKLDGKELDKADGVWYTQDFGDKLVNVRLSKSQAKTSTPRTAGGGGGGKKFNINTVELINGKYAEVQYKDTGLTFKAAWDSNSDKNYRYAIRQALLKAEGLMS